MAPRRARIGVQLWRLYADVGRFLPAAWVARAVGVSPTTMTKHLAAEGYLPMRGYTPGRGWNWSRVVRIQKVETMEKYTSNGHVFEVSLLSEEEVEEARSSPEPESGDGALLDFLSAIEQACGGVAVARAVDCERVIFKEEAGEVEKPLQVGTFDHDTGLCVSTGRYVPTLEDFQTQDWMLMAVLVPEVQTAP